MYRPKKRVRFCLKRTLLALCKIQIRPLKQAKVQRSVPGSAKRLASSSLIGILPEQDYFLAYVAEVTVITFRHLARRPVTKYEARCSAQLMPSPAYLSKIKFLIKIFHRISINHHPALGTAVKAFAPLALALRRGGGFFAKKDPVPCSVLAALEQGTQCRNEWPDGFNRKINIVFDLF